jgi:TetR/AcrR family transcriptional repressor of nem operon
MSTAPTTRDHLLAVGLERLRSTGYTATGVKEVLDLAQVPKGSFYHYFPSKEEFAVEVFHLYANGEAERSARVLGDRKVAPLKRLRRYFEELISVYGQAGEISGCLMGSLSLEVADHSPRMRSELQGVFAVWQKGIADVLQEAIQRGDLAKSMRPDALAQFLLNSYEGALIRMKAEKSDKPLENFLHFAFDVLLNK